MSFWHPRHWHHITCFQRCHRNLYLHSFSFILDKKSRITRWILCLRDIISWIQSGMLTRLNIRGSIVFHLWYQRLFKFVVFILWGKLYCCHACYSLRVFDLGLVIASWDSSKRGWEQSRISFMIPSGYLLLLAYSGGQRLIEAKRGGENIGEGRGKREKQIDRKIDRRRRGFPGFPTFRAGGP